MSEKEKSQKKRIVTELRYPLPDVRLSFDSHFDIISAYVVASNNGKIPVGYRELEAFIKIDATIVSGCNKFFQHLGLIEASEKGRKYISTEIAGELHNNRKWNNDDLTKSTLRKILENSWFWIQTKQILEINDSITSPELIQKLGLVCGAEPTKHTRALDKLIEYMRFSDLIRDNEGHFVLNNSLAKERHNDSDKPETLQALEIEKYALTSNNSPLHLTPLVVSIGVMISPDMPEEQIRKTIGILVGELQRIQSTKRDSK